ncbi:hypothetical protein ON058_01970 [Demequina sp. B12]|uniref:hypothetical protein n=1 Tax=Demequina sp. B12 TaxID=2992757 RepID=UPI00237BD1EC|nr:hypothetical protein [Demequina sp. B12]MDE0572178.1 hypothetical protein [Demequina sp. B12]
MTADLDATAGSLPRLDLPHYEITRALEEIEVARTEIARAHTATWVSAAADSYRAALESLTADLTAYENDVLDAQEACNAAQTFADRYGQ